jgi:hypothetical protein
MHVYCTVQYVRAPEYYTVCTLYIHMNREILGEWRWLGGGGVGGGGCGVSVEGLLYRVPQCLSSRLNWFPPFPASEGVGVGCKRKKIII